MERGKPEGVKVTIVVPGPCNDERIYEITRHGSRKGGTLFLFGSYASLNLISSPAINAFHSHP